MVDIEKLRNDIKQQCYGIFFGGGYGGALIQSFDVENATSDELINMAIQQGMNLKKYEI
jgi:hypothetical protein